MKRRLARDQLALAALFAVSGTLHLWKPWLFVSIVPRRLTAKSALVYASGVGELACAVGLLGPSTRRAAGLASAALLVAVFPANVQMALDAWRRPGRATRSLALLRLPLQLPMIRTAWRAAGVERQTSSRGRLAWPRVSRATPVSVWRCTVSASSTTSPVPTSWCASLSGA